MSLRCCDPKRYHHLTNFSSLCAFTAILLEKARHKLPWIPREKTSQVFAPLAWGNTWWDGKMERSHPGRPFLGAVQAVSHRCQGGTCHRAVPFRPFAQIPCHQSSSLLRSWGMKSPGSAEMARRGGLEMISNCVASAFSHSCPSLFLCLHPSQQQPHLLSVFRLSSSLSSLLKDAPQVSAPVMPEPQQQRCNPNNSMQKLY